MSEMYATNTITVIGGQAADGNAALTVPLYTKTPNNPSHVCVVDSITWAYNNTSVATVTLQLDLLPSGSLYPLWQALVTVPAGECATIDKNFGGGIPLWKGSAAQVGTGTEDFRVDFNGQNGAAIGGSTVVAGSVTPLVDGAPWITSTPHGPGVLSVTYHMEPASCRRY